MGQISCAEPPKGKRVEVRLIHESQAKGKASTEGTAVTGEAPGPLMAGVTKALLHKRPEEALTRSLLALGLLYPLGTLGLGGLV